MTTPGPVQPLAKPPAPPAIADVQAWRHWPSIAIFVLVAGALLGGDLWIKAWSFAHVAERPVVLDPHTTIDPNAFIPEHDPWVVVPHVLDLKLTVNTGAVFGLGKGRQAIFMVVSVAAAAVIFWSFARSKAGAHVLHLALALILAGALGNLYDRVHFNAVRDMFWLFPDRRVWPWIFNLADAALMVGMGLLILTLWAHDKRAQSAAAGPD